jgi:hypothetical protein
VRGTDLTVICVNLSRRMANDERSIWCRMWKMDWSLLRSGRNEWTGRQAGRPLAASPLRQDAESCPEGRSAPLSCRRHAASSGSRSRFPPYSSLLYRNSVSGTLDRVCFLCAVSVLFCNGGDRSGNANCGPRAACGPFALLWQPAKRCKTRLKQ